jgi:hypothetical protein
MAAVQHIDEVFSLDGVEFVNAVYLMLLGRPADPQGLQHYLARLERGWDKTAVIAVIATSQEAKACRVQVPGLAELLQDVRPGRRWFWRFTTRRRRIDRQMARLERGLGRIGRRLADVECILELLAGGREGEPTANQLDEMSLPGPGRSQIRPAARQIFENLFKAVKNASQQRKI